MLFSAVLSKQFKIFPTVQISRNFAQVISDLAPWNILRNFEKRKFTHAEFLL